MVVTLLFTHLSITFSNKRFTSCSPTVIVGFVKLTLNRFCGNEVFKMNMQLTYAAVLCYRFPQSCHASRNFKLGQECFITYALYFVIC
jgi:hypothetical protein